MFTFIRRMIGLISVLTLLLGGFAQCEPLCPKWSNSWPLTLNHDGHSFYVDQNSSNILLQINQSQKIPLDRPILDVGAGYGGGTYALIKMGATRLYVNDLDRDNLLCMKQHIDQTLDTHTVNIHYLAGDITSRAVINQLPDHTFGFVLAQNVIQFFSYHQLIQFIKLLNKKVATHGRVLIIFENPYLDRLNNMVSGILYQKRLHPELAMNTIVKIAYYHTSFPSLFNISRYCDFDAYNHAPADMRLPGFPCQIPSGDLNSSEKRLLLSPNIVMLLMQAAGFKPISKGDGKGHDRTQILLFEKNQNMTNDQIDNHIRTFVLDWN